MKTGKVSDTILSRSVLKPVNTVRGKYVKRLDIGQDAGEVQLACQADISDCRDTLLMATASGYMPVIKAVNNIYAAGGVPVGLSDCIVMDKDSREIRLREVIAQLTRQSAITGVSITGGHTTVSGNVTSPMVTVTAVGVRQEQRKQPQPGESIIMTGYIGMSGIRQLIDRNSDIVQARYSDDYTAKAYGSDEELYIGDVVELLRKNNINCYMHDVSEGGIFGALWDMSEYGHTGLDVDIRSISVRQEIIEICELLNVNPYELESMGCLLMTSDNDCDIINILKKNINTIENAFIIKKDFKNALKEFSNQNKTFDVIFLDPPYKLNLINPAINIILENNLLKDNGIIICEYETEEINTNNLKIFKERKYGSKKIIILKK